MPRFERNIAFSHFWTATVLSRFGWFWKPIDEVFDQYFFAGRHEIWVYVSIEHT